MAEQARAQARAQAQAPGQGKSQDAAARCAELFEVGGFAAVRRTAEAGLAEAGPDPVLYRWLGLAHAAEDEDDHDDEAERAYRRGLEVAPDDLGLLVSYVELCRRADAWEHPGRAARAEALENRIERLAPPGSPERERVDAVRGWHGRSYWEDLTYGTVVRGHVQEGGAAAQSHDVAQALARSERGESPVPAGSERTEDLRTAELAAAVELLSGPANAPLRLLLRHRVAAFVLTFALALITNRVLLMTGTVRVSLWGWLWWIPLLLADVKLRRARTLARERVVARIEARHAEAGAGAGTGAPTA
ncbi:hypothetical protein [Streptomyces sp. NPDC093225]|uniref:hypothetical protein n=1 Tax=Streptomyces sp. NPDC093225 TaxID=3366034 RepID=UPI0038126576